MNTNENREDARCRIQDASKKFMHHFIRSSLINPTVVILKEPFGFAQGKLRD